jgi:tRNA U54 and U55 pseudouridine synthase Pus10
MSIKAWVTEHCAYCVGACVSVFRFLSSRMRNMDDTLVETARVGSELLEDGLGEIERVPAP